MSDKIININSRTTAYFNLHQQSTLLWFTEENIQRDNRHIQLFRERLSEKNVHAAIRKGNMGYDQYIVPDTVAVELSFVAFL